MFKIEEIKIEPSKICTGSIFNLKIKAKRGLTFNELKELTFNELKNITFGELKGD